LHHGQHPLHEPGLFAVLAAAGADVTDEPAFRRYRARHPDDPLTRYLALHGSGAYRFLQPRLPVNLAEAAVPGESFLRRLAVCRDLYLRWQSRPWPWASRAAHRGDLDRALAFVRRHRGQAAARALLSHVQSQHGHDAPSLRALADAWGFLADAAEDDYGARYEQARCLLLA